MAFDSASNDIPLRGQTTQEAALIITTGTDSQFVTLHIPEHIAHNNCTNIKVWDVIMNLYQGALYKTEKVMSRPKWRLQKNS